MVMVIMDVMVVTWATPEEASRTEASVTEKGWNFEVCN